MKPETPGEKTALGAAAAASRASAEEAVQVLLHFIGEDPDRDGLRDTPARVVRAWQEMTRGYDLDPAQVLARVFDEKYDGLIVLRNIPFTSTCEHHLLSFGGTISIGYLPDRLNPKVVGLSKLARLVDCFARRLQVQERLTVEIAQAITEHLGARGVGVVVRAQHSCMACRGVLKPGAEMVTKRFEGVLATSSEERAEFWNMIR